MLENSNIQRGKIKGALLEIAILELLRKNNFKVLSKTDIEDSKMKQSRDGFIEIRGRGAWHQIDCPCNYTVYSSFLYPIRLLGEVKFKNKAIQKQHIREFIGVIKDIQENYFVRNPDMIEDFSISRRLDIGVYFSASGFSTEAENLAYAHGIKTISYDNNVVMEDIKHAINELEAQDINYNEIKGENFGGFIAQVKRYLANKNYVNEHISFNKFYRVINSKNFKYFVEVIKEVKCNFIATSGTGIILHFMGFDNFPSELFLDKDERNCKVHYDITNENTKNFYISLSEDIKKRRFYFTPPEILLDATTENREKILSIKKEIFNKITFDFVINGMQRHLTLRIDNNWLRDLYRTNSQ